MFWNMLMNRAFCSIMQHVGRATFSTTICKSMFTLLLFNCCRYSFNKVHLGTLKCHESNILTLKQPIRLQHLKQSKEKITLPPNILLNICKTISFSLNFSSNVYFPDFLRIFVITCNHRSLHTQPAPHPHAAFYSGLCRACVSVQLPWSRTSCPSHYTINTGDPLPL